MKAIYIQNYGPVEQMVEFGEMPMPLLQPKDVLIEVRAASVNPIDYLIVKGYMQSFRKITFPSVLGSDVAGVVVEVGSEVTRFKKGDAVFSRVDPLRTGTFSQYIAVDEGVVANKPRTLDFEQAAALPLVGLTALQGLIDKAQIKAGQKILIHAGAGGVGSTAIQIAKLLGAWVATTVGTESIELVKALGADQIIDYKTQRFEDVCKDFDAVFDMLGGDTQTRSFSVLKPGGVLVAIVPLPDAPALAAKAGVRLEVFFMQPSGQQLAQLADWADQGKLKPVIDRCFTLEQTKDALLYSQSGRAKGKIIIQVS